MSRIRQTHVGGQEAVGDREAHLAPTRGCPSTHSDAEDRPGDRSRDPPMIAMMIAWSDSPGAKVTPGLILGSTEDEQPSGVGGDPPGDGEPDELHARRRHRRRSGHLRVVSHCDQAFDRRPDCRGFATRSRRHRHQRHEAQVVEVGPFCPSPKSNPKIFRRVVQRSLEWCVPPVKTSCSNSQVDADITANASVDHGQEQALSPASAGSPTSRANTTPSDVCPRRTATTPWQRPGPGRTGRTGIGDVVAVGSARSVVMTADARRTRTGRARSAPTIR